MPNEPSFPSRQLPPRRVALACLFTLLGAGIGHLYAGRGRRGAVFFAIQLLHIPTLMALAWLEPSSTVFGLLVGLIGSGVLFILFVLVDAGRVASATRTPYLAKAYNNAALYAGLVVLGAIWGTVGMVSLRTWSFEAFRVPTVSMEPTIPAHARILVNKWPPRAIRRGDIVIYRAPGGQDHRFVKRVIGLPGESVSMDGHQVLINGKPLRENRWSVRWKGAPTGSSPEPFAVPANHYFVLGDNRGMSMDSRRTGPVPADDILGVAHYLWWPEFGMLR